MNAHYLHKPDGTPTKWSQCGECGSVAAPGNYDVSVKCCTCYDCGGPLGKDEKIPYADGRGRSLYHRDCELKRRHERAEPTREINDLAIQLTAEGCLASGGMVIAAWGPHAKHRDRHNELLKILAGVPLHALVVTKDGFPGHPLYIPYDRAPVRWP
jgi:hypothetical protein